MLVDIYQSTSVPYRHLVVRTGTDISDLENFGYTGQRTVPQYAPYAIIKTAVDLGCGGDPPPVLKEWMTAIKREGGHFLVLSS
jgi:hypothetical protein